MEETTQPATIVVQGFSPVELRRRAARDCRASFGDAWRITAEAITPRLVSIGGRVRLYEGRFRVTHT